MVDNIEELLTGRGIKYNYSGADLVVRCMNPEHEDRNPSMRIDKITGTFNCYSCGYSGNIYKVFNIYRNLLDIRVKNLLEKINKINKPKITMPLGTEKFTEDYRGISKETFEHFEAFTLPGDKEFDGRIVFPIRDINEDIACFQARYLYSKLSPKYIFRPSGASPPLFPAVPGILHNSIILVEGMFDMLNLFDKGLTNTVCTFGVSLTNKSDRNNLKLKNRFASYKLQGANKIYIMFDGDKAGKEGAKQLFAALKDSFIIEIIELEDGTDPGTLSTEDINSIKGYLYGEHSNSR